MFGFNKLNELVLNIGLNLKPPLVSRLANWKLPITVFSSSMRRVCQNVFSYAKKIYVCVVKGQLFCTDLRRANTNFVKVLIWKLRKAAVSNQTLETRPPPNSFQSLKQSGVFISLSTTWRCILFPVTLAVSNVVLFYNLLHTKRSMFLFLSVIQ